MRCAGLIGAVLAAASGPLAAHPDGAPWDYDGAKEAPDCTACHFDAAAIGESQSVALEGLPAAPKPETTYELVLKLRSQALKNAGFLMTLYSKNGGALESLDERTETEATGIRSTYSGSRGHAPGEASWRILWRTPEKPSFPIELYIAANAGNDDESPFGDEIHLKSYRFGEAREK